MKTVKFFLSVVFICLIQNLAYAQIPAVGENIFHSTLDKFEGVWKWTSGSQEVIVKIKKVHYFFVAPASYTEDVLMGVHSYKKDGVTIEDFTSNFLTIGQDSRGTLFLWGKTNESNPDDATGTVKDQLKEKFNIVSITYLSGTVPQIQWFLSNRSEPPLRKSSQLPFDYAFTLPDNITLTKQ